MSVKEKVKSLFTRHRRQVDLEEYLKAMKASGKWDEEARHEMMDPQPMAPPLGFVKQPSLHEQIRNMVRSERLRQEVEAAGAGSFDQEDDFSLPDDDAPHSGYEDEFSRAGVSDVEARVHAEALQRQQPPAASGSPQAAPTPNPPPDGPGAPKNAP